ncbi:MAG: MFS transporter, partial [Clostridiales bacterium]
QMPKPQTPNLPLATNLHWRQMLKTTRFYLLILIFISGTMAGLMLVSNTAVMGQTMFGLTATTAALFVSIYALCNCGGRFIFGMLSDRLGHYQTIILICLLISIVLLQAAIIHNLFSFLLTLIGVGLGFGGIMGIFPSLTSALFGLKYCGVNYGVVFIGYSLGALIATATGGDFTPAFLIAMGFSLAGMVFTMLLKKSTT